MSPTEWSVVVITKVWTAHVPMEVFRLKVKHEQMRQQLPESTRYLCNCILAESGGRVYLVCFLLLQLSDLTLSHYFEPIAPLVILTGGNHQLSNLPRIPESFRRGPD